MTDAGRRDVVASAPGKLILFGEHAVVYGVPALAASLSGLRIRVRVVRSPAASAGGGAAKEAAPPAGLDIRLDSLGFACRLPLDALAAAADAITPMNSGNRLPPDSGDVNLAAVILLEDAVTAACTGAGPGVDKAVLPLLYLYLHILFPVSTSSGESVAFHVESMGLPVGAGLGSSAAFSVALVAALLEASLGASDGGADVTLHMPGGNAAMPCRRPDEARLHLINEWAFVSEKLLHGTPSGLDNTTSTYGGAISYVREPRSINRIESFPELRLLLTNTQVPRSTSVLVGNVRKLRARHPAVVNACFAGMQAITDDCLSAIKAWDSASVDGDADSNGGAGESIGSSAEVTGAADRDQVLSMRLASLIGVNQGLLGAIGVGHPALDLVCNQVSEITGLSTKLTGAGGGGCAFTLLGSGKYAILGADPDGKLDALRTKLENEAGCVTFLSGAGGLGVCVHTTPTTSVDQNLGLLGDWVEIREDEDCDGDGDPRNISLSADGTAVCFMVNGDLSADRYTGTWELDGAGTLDIIWSLYEQNDNYDADSSAFVAQATVQQGFLALPWKFSSVDQFKLHYKKAQ